jgi:D-alanyl-D-alanine carboxypeptidase (penicillin-binding protein 5/6)
VSYSPLMTPPRPSGHRARALARRRRRRAVLLGALALAGVAIAVVLATSGGGRHLKGRSAEIAHGRRPSRAPARHLSPVGFPLAKPAFALSGLGAPGQDPLPLEFHKPPRAGVLFDLSSGRVLWQRDPLARLRIASLTKMMTALLVVRSGPPGAHVLVTKQAVNAAGSKVGVLPKGRRVRLESMLYGLLLPSGNDAAVALAQHVAGSVSRFVERMNREAADLGLGCTRFSSPSGFIDRHNYSCARDLAVLAHVDLRQPRLARVTRTRSAVLPFPIKGGRLFLYNNNPMLVYHYPGATGLKTGYTVASGRCLVATAERHGVRLGAVLLDSPEPGIQARALLDRAFEQIYGQAPVSEPPFPPHA